MGIQEMSALLTAKADASRVREDLNIQNEEISAHLSAKAEADEVHQLRYMLEHLEAAMQEVPSTAAFDELSASVNQKIVTHLQGLPTVVREQVIALMSEMVLGLQL